MVNNPALQALSPKQRALYRKRVKAMTCEPFVDERMASIIAISLHNLENREGKPEVVSEPIAKKKKCKGCGLTLDLAGFYRSGRGKFTSRCRTCWRQKYGK